MRERHGIRPITIYRLRSSMVLPATCPSARHTAAALRTTAMYAPLTAAAVGGLFRATELDSVSILITLLGCGQPCCVPDMWIARPTVGRLGPSSHLTGSWQA